MQKRDFILLLLLQSSRNWQQPDPTMTALNRNPQQHSLFLWGYECPAVTVEPTSKAHSCPLRLRDVKGLRFREIRMSATKSGLRSTDPVRALRVIAGGLSL